MDTCLRKDCDGEIFEEGLCAKHYNEIVKKIVSEVSGEPSAAKIDTHSEREREEVSMKTKFLLLSLLSHVDKFADTLITSFGNVFNLSRNETAEIYRQMGDKLVKKSDNKKAIPILRKAVELGADDADSKYELGCAYLSEGMIEQAIDCIEDAIKQSPDIHDYHFKMGIACEQKELWDAAIASYEKAIKINPEDAAMYYRLGVIYDNTKKFKDAVTSFTKAIELDPKHADYYQSLGFTYESVDQHKEAIKCYKKAISLRQEYR